MNEADFKRTQELCKKYNDWKEEMKKKYLAFDPVDAFIAGYEMGNKEGFEEGLRHEDPDRP